MFGIGLALPFLLQYYLNLEFRVLPYLSISSLASLLTRHNRIGLRLRNTRASYRTSYSRHELLFELFFTHVIPDMLLQIL